MGNEDGITNEYFRARELSRSEFEAVKRSGDYEELSDVIFCEWEQGISHLL